MERDISTNKTEKLWLVIKILTAVLLLVPFAIDLVEFVFVLGEMDVSRAASLSLDVVQAVVYLAFLTEGILSFQRFRREGKGGISDFARKNAADCIYFVLCPIVLLLAFLFGSTNTVVLILLWACFFVKLSAVTASFRKPDPAAGQRRRSPYTKKENAVRFSVLAVFLLLFAIGAFKLVYNRIPSGALLAFDIVWAAAYLFFTAELIVRLMGYKKNYGKSFLKEYWKFNKAEPIFEIACLAVLICAFVFGSNNNWVEIVLWVCFLLKMPNVTKRFNDENVFNIVVKGIMLLLIALFVVPLLNLIAMAFSSSSSMLGGEIVNLFPRGFTFYSTKYIVMRMDFWRSIGVSILVTISGTVLSVFLMALCAYPLSKPNMPFKKVVLVYFLICMLFSGGMAPKILLMSALRLNETPFALILPSLVNVFNLLLLKGFFEGLPAELEESARLDGANNYQVLFHIVAPMSVPMMMTVAMFTAISYWNNFYNALMYLTEKKTWHPIPMYIKNFFSMSEKDLSYADPTAGIFIENIKMALILVSIIPIALVYPLTLKYFTKGVAVGSVKG